MTVHIHGSVLTGYGIAANNRGESPSCTTTLQKITKNGSSHTTVSAEAIRSALRRQLEDAHPGSCNRTIAETRENQWKDPNFEGWSSGARTYADDDLLGFMRADPPKNEEKKGTCTARRSVIEIARAESLTPWTGDVIFNAASPGASPAAAKKGVNPVPYGAEVHATRYQYGFSLTPARLRDPGLAAAAINHLCSLSSVAGNHARFLYDFSPESIVLRVTHDPAPRILNCFEDDDGKIGFPRLLALAKAGDIDATEVVIGGAIVQSLSEEDKATLRGATLSPGIKAAAAALCARFH